MKFILQNLFCRIYIISIYFGYLTNYKSKSEKIVIKAKYIFSEIE